MVRRLRSNSDTFFQLDTHNGQIFEENQLLGHTGLEMCDIWVLAIEKLSKS